MSGRCRRSCPVVAAAPWVRGQEPLVGYLRRCMLPGAVALANTTGMLISVVMLNTPSTALAEDGRVLQFGPLGIGGAMRVNYVKGDYETDGDGPSRGSRSGNFELDTFRINLILDHEQFTGGLEYRWYDGYNFLKDAWLGFDFDADRQLQLGLTRVPFGPGPYGVSKSWFFDQHYYLGLSDDPDLGLRYLHAVNAWQFDIAWFVSSERNGRGTSIDSSRFGYDAVEWESAITADGSVVAASGNGYSERNQVNARAIVEFDAGTQLGASLQYGLLEGQGADDGSHWAASVHMVNQWDRIALNTQLTRYHFDIDSDNALGTDTLIPLGAYDFAWPVAASSWVAAASLSYLWETPRINWLDSATFYIEYSSIIKTEDEFNDSQLALLGAAWASGGWYVYTDLVYSNGNTFVGDKGDDYSRIDGVGDLGVNGNDRWNYRLNVNFGYYF
jgi:hypothetical protein